MCNDSVQSDEGRVRANLKGISVNMPVIPKHRALLPNRPPILYAKCVTYCTHSIADFSSHGNALISYITVNGLGINLCNVQSSC